MGEIFEILADDGPAIFQVLPFPADRLDFLGQALLLGAEAVLFRREVSLALVQSFLHRPDGSLALGDGPGLRGEFRFAGLDLGLSGIQLSPRGFVLLREVLQRAAFLRDLEFASA